MRGSLVAVLLGCGLVVLLLVFGLTEARTRQARSERLGALDERVSALEERVAELEKRLRLAEGKAKR